MQTFLPYPSFFASAHVLDRARLGKQRVEAMQILRALRGETIGWRYHPATRMWRGYDGALAQYGLACCEEWIRRGYKDTVSRFFMDGSRWVQPPWLGDATFHRSHQSNLIRKAPTIYGALFPGVPSDLPYVWPSGVAQP
jgi:hypothetical protein